MATISGNVNRERVIVVHKDNHLPVFDVATDNEGDWSVEVPGNQPFMVIYIHGNCQPEIHGPYWGAE